MYAKEFGFCRRPFPATPDPGLYYPATSHEAAVANLSRAVAEDEGFALLTGAAGTGKTLVGQCLVERLGPDVASAFLTNSHFADRSSLLQAVLYDFSLRHDGGEQTLRLRLTDYLLENCAAGRRALLLVDEAQHLSPDLLEELRLLGNLEAGKDKAFQVILVGQEKLLQTLALPEMAACSQRLAVRTRVEPLGIEEGIDYLLHHLRLAGDKAEAIFDEPALEILARGAGGVPRRLNQAAHQALSLAHLADMSRVDAEAALEALAMLGLEHGATEPVAEHRGEENDQHEENDRGMIELIDAASLRSIPVPEDETGVRLFESPRPA